MVRRVGWGGDVKLCRDRVRDGVLRAQTCLVLRFAEEWKEIGIDA